MRNIRVPERVEDYVADLHRRAFPDERIVDEPFYARLVQWVLAHRTPLLYEQDHPGEYRNLSINFNWLLIRDYAGSLLGPAELISSMYVLHEFVHMTHWLPTRLDEMTAGEYAEQFTRSEYRASNETEILLHYRVPQIRAEVFDGMTLAVDVLLARDEAQPTAARLARMRPVLVEDSLLDDYFGRDEQGRSIAEHFKRFTGNRAWAVERFAAIRPHFLVDSFVAGHGLTDADYEGTISSFEGVLDQATYERNVVRNVRFGFAMCGQPVPDIDTFADACDAAANLEGHRAIVQS